MCVVVMAVSTSPVLRTHRTLPPGRRERPPEGRPDACKQAGPDRPRPSTGAGRVSHSGRDRRRGGRGVSAGLPRRAGGYDRNMLRGKGDLLWDAFVDVMLAAGPAH